MFRYPPEITSVLAPLVVVQGLGEEGTLFKQTSVPEFPEDKQIRLHDADSPDSPLSRLFSDPDTVERRLPSVQVASGLELAHVLRDHSLESEYWYKDYEKKHLSFRFKFAGSTFRLPKHAERADDDRSVSSDESASASPISPFNPDSPCYRSILPLEWIQKYRELLPSVFIAVHELDAGSDENDKTLALELNDTREKLAKHGIKFVCVLLCSSPSTPELEERVATLRRTTSLPSKTGILVLPAGSQKELESFAGVLMALIRPWCTEYYAVQEKKVKRQQLMDASYSEKFWLARQALKSAVLGELKGVTEHSTKLMEYSYEKLIDVIRSISRETQPERWHECRLLLDFAGIHITRGYLVLGNANMAYKKFDIHLQNILSVLPSRSLKSYPVISWLALQLTWLAQLVEKCPESIVSVERPFQQHSSSKWFGTSVDGLPMPHGGYIYLQACSLVHRREIQAASGADVYDTYMALSPDEEKQFDYHGTRVRLLSRALELFTRAKKTKFNRSESYVYFQLGEEYFGMENYSMAANNFLVALSAFKNEKWNQIAAMILFRLFQCSVKLENYKDAQIRRLQLCTLEDRFVARYQDDLGQEMPVDEPVVLKEPLFDGHLVFKHPSVSLHEKVHFQLYLRPLVNSLMAELVAERVEVVFAGGEFRVVVENETGPNTPLCIVTDGRANLDFSRKQAKVLQFELQPDKIGKFTVDSVRLVLRSGSLSFENQLVSVCRSPDRLKWYRPSSSKFNKPFECEIVNGAQNGFEVIPKPPEVDFRVSHASIAYKGEKVPITVHIGNQDENSFGLRLHATGKLATTSLKVTWADEADHSASYRVSDALRPHDSADVELFAHLPLAETDGDTVRIDLQVDYLIDNNENTVVRKTKPVQIPVVDLFKTSFRLYPSLSSHIPSLFDVSAAEIVAVPSHDRCWRSKLAIENVSAEDVAISNVSVEINKTTPETVVETTLTDFPVSQLGAKSTGDGWFEFRCRCADGVFKRSMGLELYLSFEYVLQGRPQSLTNRYRALLWKGTLPHMDPRTLVSVDYAADALHVTYVIENPTSRIFQFSTTLSTSENFKIRNYRNQHNFSVLPFMKQVLRLEYEQLAGEEWTKLPEFRIYDLNYKIYLNAQPTSDRLQSRTDGVYVRK
ncbi:hypothetical protein KL933_004955 [Ogataea haglerorum]|uniref:Trafficking protein particle complex subunit 11 domain-containing protein n=1 Tax=Ogataea haglerorum TaxID=1937702 RepID=A0AAN6D166_9ASCO|nr:hypothetical protein KL933_004955 [Ogataea haglerorum]